mmetsp:Transcript_32387/g.97483  ORF Transcript_32387/g.97483 Transcript_32387/m.97483 type:complete len:148 (+) Transcript_32387:94-537(+)
MESMSSMVAPCDTDRTGDCSARAHKRRTASSGEKTLQLNLLSLNVPWTDPQDAIKVMGNSATSQDMVEKHVNNSDPMPCKPSRRFYKRLLHGKDQLFHERWLRPMVRHLPTLSNHRRDIRLSSQTATRCSTQTRLGQNQERATARPH